MTSLYLKSPQRVINRIVEFLHSSYAEHHIDHAVIAISGGIDSAVSLTLLSQALPKEQIFPLLLPYKNQNMDDAKTICVWAGIPQKNWQEINIRPMVDLFINKLHVPRSDDMRRGNIMARVRMITVYDRAKMLNALVCGTENKSEKYLGYFTRFGDEASDIEPLQHLYKTQIRQLAIFLGLPNQILIKDPSAGLWNGQTDENELGFSYEQADQVLEQYIDKHVNPEHLRIEGIEPETIRSIVERVQSQSFKLHVPYHIK